MPRQCRSWEGREQRPVRRRQLSRWHAHLLAWPVRVLWQPGGRSFYSINTTSSLDHLKQIRQIVHLPDSRTQIL